MSKIVNKSFFIGIIVGILVTLAMLFVLALLDEKYCSMNSAYSVEDTLGVDSVLVDPEVYLEELKKIRNR